MKEEEDGSTEDERDGSTDEEEETADGDEIAEEKAVEDAFLLLDEVPLHFPNFRSHPLPQYAEDFPQNPYFEQQLPSAEPMHVYPFFPPHVPSLEITAVDVGAEAEGVDDFEEGVFDVEADLELERIPLQEPKVGWHPVPQ